MRVNNRKVGAALSALFAAAAIAVSSANPAVADKALIIAGLDTPSMNDEVMKRLLGWRFNDDERISVEWPAEARPYTGSGDLTLGESIAIGKQNLATALQSALASGEHVIVVGLSAGSLVVDEVLRDLVGTAEDPTAEQMSIVIVADSTRQKVISEASYNSRHNFTYQPPPETRHNTITVTGEYDGMADFPDRWWNLLAVANAFAGSIVVHVPVMFENLDLVPAKNITTTVNSVGGETTHYLVPTKTLPLVQLMPWMKWREASLKASVDRGYSRNDAPPPAAKTTSTTTTTAKTTSTPTTTTTTKTADAGTTAVKTTDTTGSTTAAVKTTDTTDTTTTAVKTTDTTDKTTTGTAVKADTGSAEEETTPSNGTKIRETATDDSTASDTADEKATTSDSGAAKTTGDTAATETTTESGAKETTGDTSSTGNSSAATDTQADSASDAAA
jgi:hypothetical protein